MKSGSTRPTTSPAGYIDQGKESHEENLAVLRHLDSYKEQVEEEFGMWGWRDDEDRPRVLWFDLEPVDDFCPDWKGRLIIAGSGVLRDVLRRRGSAGRGDGIPGPGAMTDHQIRLAAFAFLEEQTTLHDDSVPYQV